MSANYLVTATGTGGSSSVLLHSGCNWILTITSATFGDADLQCSIDGGTTFVDVLDAPAGSVVNVTANRSLVVRGGAYYRLDVNSYVADILLNASPSS